MHSHSPSKIHYIHCPDELPKVIHISITMGSYSAPVPITELPDPAFQGKKKHKVQAHSRMWRTWLQLSKASLNMYSTAQYLNPSLPFLFTSHVIAHKKTRKDNEKNQEDHARRKDPGRKLIIILQQHYCITIVHVGRPTQRPADRVATFQAVSECPKST